MNQQNPVTIRNILSENKTTVITNILLTSIEIALMALIPLFIGLAIDDLLAKQMGDLWILVSILMSLVVVSVARRFYDTRAYGRVRVNVQRNIVSLNQSLSVSILNARLDMGRELVDFLEQDVPEILNACIQFIISLIVLYFLNPVLALTAFSAAILMIVIYALFHSNFYRLNGIYNKQTERQVEILNTNTNKSLIGHFNRLKNLEVKISDTEAILYGLVFISMLSMIVFNLWYSTGNMQISAGKIFTIVSYSWEFVEAAIMLPITLQSWSRLSEITQRINPEPVINQ